MDQSLKCAKLSRAAYNKNGYSINKKYLIESKKTDTQCYVFAENDITYIVFRGTEKKFRDIFTDLWAFKKELPFKNKKGIRVHRGFLDAYMSVRDEILTKVLELNSKRIIITGHSLGGALATLCGVDLQKNSIVHWHNLHLATFGSPKVGNRKFKKSFNNRVFSYDRYVNRLDLVPLMPFSCSAVGKKVKAIHKFKHDINNYIYNLT
jgi:predicted lipase